MERLFQQKEINDILKFFRQLTNSKKFYFTGGTVLSEFYIYHRISLDLDIFAEKKLKDKKPYLINETADEFIHLLKQKKFKINLLRKHLTCVEFETMKNTQMTRLTLAFDTAPLLRKTIYKKDGIRIASFDDIATAKLSALVERLEIRDIIDLYFIGQKKDLLKIIELAKRRWEYIDEYQIATIFKKIEQITPALDAFEPFLLKPLKRENLFAFYNEQAIRILNYLRKS